MIPYAGKFARQLATAKRLIAKYGTTVTWKKAPLDPTDTSAYPTIVGAGDFPAQVVFIPQNRLSEYTNVTDLRIDQPNVNLFCLLAGNQAFVPEQEDTVMLADSSIVTVSYMNVIQPDLQPILYIIGLS